MNNLIYSVPNPNISFFGVRFTKIINKGLEADPNAVLVFKREGYSLWDVDFRELMEI